MAKKTFDVVDLDASTDGIIAEILVLPTGIVVCTDEKGRDIKRYHGRVEAKALMIARKWAWQKVHGYPDPDVQDLRKPEARNTADFKPTDAYED